MTINDRSEWISKWRGDKKETQMVEVLEEKREMVDIGDLESEKHIYDNKRTPSRWRVDTAVERGFNKKQMFFGWEGAD